MSIEIGSKVKIKANDMHFGATGSVIATCDFGWEWLVQIDSEADIELGYNSDELEEPAK